MELSKLKQLLGIDSEDTSKDVPLNFAMDNVQEVINNYCHTAEIPAVPSHIPAGQPELGISRDEIYKYADAGNVLRYGRSQRGSHYSHA